MLPGEVRPGVESMSLFSAGRRAAEAEAAAKAAAKAARALYLDLMKRCLTNVIYGDPGIVRFEERAFDASLRATGRDWPLYAHTMVGLTRLDNLQFCVEDVLARNVPGDLMETGVWRGGASIFMRAILKAHGVENRRVWAADSFAGMPVPDAQKYPIDAGLDFSPFNNMLGVSLEHVQENFRVYGLLDEQVRFLKGWFRDTLPTAPVERLAVLRLDGDLYESTMDALTHLYPKLEVGGYLIIDDYENLVPCAQAVTDYRERNDIIEPIKRIDWSAVYWRKDWLVSDDQAR